MSPTQVVNPLVRSFVQVGLPTSVKKGAPRSVVGVQPERWTVTLAAYGSASTFSMSFALRGGDRPTSETSGPGAVTADQLTDNLYHASGQGLISVTISVGRPADAVRWSPSELTQVFTGYIDLVDWEFDTDLVTITGRDAASLLMDSRTLTNFQNRTPSAIATQFAQDVGLTPLVAPAPSVGGAPLLAGHYYTQDTVHMGAIPRQKWDILLYLARQMGWDLYVTPHAELYFGPPPQSSPKPIRFRWRDPMAPPGEGMKTCKVSHSPRRNKTFQVLVKSYHPKEKQATLGSVAVLGVDFPVSATKTLAAGTYRGQGEPGTIIYNELGTGLEGKPVYEFHFAGLDQTQVQQRAEAIAKDIAKRELVCDFMVEGNSAVSTQSILQLSGLGYGFDTRLFYPSRVVHDYTISDRGSTGWTTAVTALNLPPSAVDDPSQAVQSS